MTAQPTLFATADLDLDCNGRPVDVDRINRWRTLFTSADWVAPYDTADGMKAGESKPGWQCPVCGQVEPNSFWLGLNHGWHPGTPGRHPWHGYCWVSAGYLDLHTRGQEHDDLWDWEADHR